MWNKLRNVVSKITFSYINGRAFVDGVPTKNYMSSWIPATPATAVTDRFVESANMKVGTYTIANASPSDGLCRNVTCTRTVVDGADTPGTLTVVGTDYNDEVISEVLIPGAHTIIVRGNLAFKTVVSVTGAGWVINTTEDTIVVGHGDKIGFPSIIKSGEVVCQIWNNAVVDPSTTPAAGLVHCSPRISECTITLPAAANNAKKIIVIMLKYTGR